MESLLEQIRLELGYSPYVCGLCPSAFFPSLHKAFRHSWLIHPDSLPESSISQFSLPDSEALVWRQFSSKLQHLSFTPSKLASLENDVREIKELVIALP